MPGTLPKPAGPGSGCSAFAPLAGSRSASRPAAQYGLPFPGGGVLLLRLPRKSKTSAPSSGGSTAAASRASWLAELVPPRQRPLFCGDYVAVPVRRPRQRAAAVGPYDVCVCDRVVRRILHSASKALLVSANPEHARCDARSANRQGAGGQETSPMPRRTSAGVAGGPGRTRVPHPSPAGGRC